MEFIKKVWANRYIYAQRLALAATPVNLFNIWMFIGIMDKKVSSTFLLLLFVVTFVVGATLTISAYCLCGFGTALKYSLNIAKWGWRIVPFPYDLATLVIAFVYSLLVLLVIPIIPIRNACKANQIANT